jgi:hypothetical protein
MVSGVMIFIKSFVRIGSGIQKLMGGYTDAQTHREKGGLKSLSLFFQRRKER